ncbi:hypothetical protein GCM10027048_33520 [Hymenobacter coalescens]
MRKFLLFLTAVTVLSLGGCKKVEKEVDKLLTFYIADDYAFSLPMVPAVLSGQTVAAPPFTTSTDATEEFRKANTAANLVKDVKLDELTLAIEGPAGANFDFLESVSFYISTDAQGTDKVKMASLTNVPRGVTTIRLETNDTKMDKYLKAQTYALTVEPTFRGATTQSTNMRINYKFKVTADPL